MSFVTQFLYTVSLIGISSFQTHHSNSHGLHVIAARFFCNTVDNVTGRYFNSSHSLFAGRKSVFLFTRYYQESLLSGSKQRRIDSRHAFSVSGLASASM